MYQLNRTARGIILWKIYFKILHLNVQIFSKSRMIIPIIDFPSILPPDKRIQSLFKTQNKRMWSNANLAINRKLTSNHLSVTLID